MIFHKNLESYINQTSISGGSVARLLSWCMIVSVAWISEPIEIPIPLLTPFMLLLITLTNPLKINISPQYVLFFIFSLFFLLAHYFFDRINGKQLGWQFMRTSLPLLGLMLFSCNWKSLGMHGQHIFRKNAVIGSAVLLGSEAIIRVSAYPSLAVGSILGDLIALYDFKSASFLFQDGNVCAFISTYLFCYSLIINLNSSRLREAGEIAVFWQLVLIAIVYFSFSRQAWFAVLASLIIYFAYRIMEALCPRILDLADSPMTIIVFIFIAMIVFLYSPQNLVAEFNEINQDSFGSASTKFAIATYTALFLSEASVLDLLIGIGPQNVIDKNVISYVGHSLIGLFPEFGFSLVFLLFMWLRRVHGGLILLPLLVGATFSLYPFAYLLPVYILQSTLPRAGYRKVERSKLMRPRVLC